MASTDSKPVPQKNVAYRHYFDIRKNDGTLITTWAGMDSEVSKDGGSFTDCTNEATEIGTSGCGYIDLTSTEMNADHVYLKITVTNTSALPVTVPLYPEEAGDIRVNATQWNSLTTVALPLCPTTAGRTLDVTAGGNAGIDWANVEAPTTSLALTGTTIATTQKVDVETIKTQTVTCAAGVTVYPAVGMTATARTNLETVYNTDFATAYNTTTDGWNVNAKHINGVATTSVTTVNANIGTTQPIKFTAYGADYVVWVDMKIIQGDETQAMGLANAGGNYSDFSAFQSDIAKIKGTALAETSAGYLAASFSEMHDVATPVFTTASVNQTGNSYAIVSDGTNGNAAIKTTATAIATVLSGITSLAQWLGLIAGKQTGNTTARTELRASGAGSGTYDETTDSLEAIKDAGSGGLDAAGVRAAIGLTSANLDTQLADLPTVSEINARTLVAADYFDPATDTVANVTTVGTTTNLTNLPTIPANWITAAGLATDAVAEIQSGLSTLTTGDIPTAAAIADAVLDEATAGHTTAGTLGKAVIDTLADTNELQTNQGNWLTATGFSTFDPTTDVVARVTLVDTTTTNTDMRGTDSAYTGTPPSAATISTQVAADLQTAHGSGAWTTATGFATPTNVSDAQTAIIAQVDASETKIDTLTTTVGAAGAGLTALPWNAAWNAEVQSEVADAINASPPVDGSGVGIYSVAYAALALTHSNRSSATTLLVKSANGTTIGTHTLTEDDTLDPVSVVGDGS